MGGKTNMKFNRVFGKYHIIEALATEKCEIRKHALSLIKSYFSSKYQVTESDFLDFWKGICKCFWHSNLITIQAFFIPHLSSLVLNLAPTSSLLYFECLFTTLRSVLFSTDTLCL